MNSMATEKISLTVVWKNVRKMRSRERWSEIMDWIERSNSDICAINEMSVVKGETELLTKEVGELRVQSINKDKEVAEVKTKEEDSWAIVAKKMKSHNVFERLEKVESDMI